MASVIIPGGIEILQTVQTVLHCMIADMILIQIIPDGVGIAIDINILVFLQVHRYVRCLQSGIFPRKPDTVLQIPQEISGIQAVFCQLREIVLSLLIELQDFLKQVFRFSKLLDILDSTKVAVPAFLAGSASARIFNSFKNVTYA